MALLFGFLGLLIAVPLLAAVMVPIKMLYVQDALDDRCIEDEATTAGCTPGSGAGGVARRYLRV